MPEKPHRDEEVKAYQQEQREVEFYSYLIRSAGSQLGSMAMRVLSITKGVCCGCSLIFSQSDGVGNVHLVAWH